MKLVVSSAEKKQTKFRYESLAIVAADFLDAQTALSKLRKIYKSVDPKDADVIIALGGDGFILQTSASENNSKLAPLSMYSFVEISSNAPSENPEIQSNAMNPTIITAITTIMIFLFEFFLLNLSQLYFVFYFEIRQAVRFHPRFRI